MQITNFTYSDPCPLILRYTVLVYPVFESDWIQMMIGILIGLIVYFVIMSIYTVYETYMIITSQRVVIVMPTTR